MSQTAVRFWLMWIMVGAGAWGGCAEDPADDTDAGLGGDGDADGDSDSDADSDADGDADANPALFTVDAQPASDVDANAPGTVGIVTWSVASGTVSEAHIDFGLDTGYGMTAPVDLAEAGYRTLLLGMKPSRTYHFKVAATVDGAAVSSGDYTIETGPGTNLATLSSFDVIDESSRERGFIVTEYYQSSVGGGGQGGSIVFIIDPDGEIVWWYQSSTNSLARARMSADGKHMWMVVSGLSGASLERVTMDTLDAQSYNVSASHDITPVSGSSMAFLEYGESDCDSIYEIDDDGTTREIFESSDYLSNSCHGNALRYSAAEDVYTFSDHMTGVFIVNRDGSLDWRLTDLVGSNNTWGGAQHGHHLLDDSILIFANNGGSGGAAAIEYNLSSGSEQMRYAPGVSTSNLGDVQRLPGGNTLVTFSTAAKIHEIDASGNPVLTIETGNTVGYSMWRASLYGSSPDLAL